MSSSDKARQLETFHVRGGPVGPGQTVPYYVVLYCVVSPRGHFSDVAKRACPLVSGSTASSSNRHFRLISDGQIDYLSSTCTCNLGVWVFNVSALYASPASEYHVRSTEQCRAISVISRAACPAAVIGHVRQRTGLEGTTILIHPLRLIGQREGGGGLVAFNLYVYTPYPAIVNSA